MFDKLLDVEKTIINSLSKGEADGVKGLMVNNKLNDSLERLESMIIVEDLAKAKYCFDELEPDVVSILGLDNCCNCYKSICTQFAYANANENQEQDSKVFYANLPQRGNFKERKVRIEPNSLEAKFKENLNYIEKYDEETQKTLIRHIFFPAYNKLKEYLLSDDLEVSEYNEDKIRVLQECAENNGMTTKELRTKLMKTLELGADLTFNAEEKKEKKYSAIKDFINKKEEQLDEEQ